MFVLSGPEGAKSARTEEMALGVMLAARKSDRCGGAGHECLCHGGAAKRLWQFAIGSLLRTTMRRTAICLTAAFGFVKCA